jgi:hypothetical protein
MKTFNLSPVFESISMRVSVGFIFYPSEFILGVLD